MALNSASLYGRLCFEPTIHSAWLFVWSGLDTLSIPTDYEMGEDGMAEQIERRHLSETID